MHIITGIIMAALLGKKKKTKQTLLDLGWPIKTTHYLPGRVRFQIPLQLKSIQEIERAMVELRKIDDVKSAEVSAVTGSILIYYNTDNLQAELLLAALIKLLALEKELEKTPTSIVAKELKELGNSFNHLVHEKSGGFIDLWTLLPLALGAVGIVKIFSKQTNIFPAPISMIWWAYNTLIYSKRNN